MAWLPKTRSTLVLTLDLLLFALFIPFWPLFWLMCRLHAQVCPQCGSKWQTELMGEWQGEHWKCHNCQHSWEVPYESPRRRDRELDL